MLKNYESIAKKLTLEQKAKLLTGNAMFNTNEHEELGIKQLWMSDGPYGVRASGKKEKTLSGGCTAFPTGSAQSVSAARSERHSDRPRASTTVFSMRLTPRRRPLRQLCSRPIFSKSSAMR